MISLVEVSHGGVVEAVISLTLQPKELQAEVETSTAVVPTPWSAMADVKGDGKVPSETLMTVDEIKVMKIDAGKAVAYNIASAMVPANSSLVGDNREDP